MTQQFSEEAELEHRSVHTWTARRGHEERDRSTMIYVLVIVAALAVAAEVIR